MYDITSIEDLINLLGGDTVLGEHLGISQPAVANWKVRGQIGSGWHLRLYAEVRRRGMTIDPNVFGLSEWEAEGLTENKGPLGRAELQPSV